ncbi:hypothetical protein [Chryseobacterium taiwanense]|uniref:Uncharacterized protein n=1 Tax=Chryseobacterium taiwanense TaxID=363331 RepID=A0A0B4EAX1_9FLAO|nr:hypothetical protein [Chryseobacterium taiwanense]KIC63743.1 hypothetical protein RM51_08835 [Chryseobacterium taiwanense]
MIYVVLFIIAILTVSFIIFSIVGIYCKIIKKESKAFLGMVMSLILLFLMMNVRNHLVKNELVKNIKTATMIQKSSNFSKKELVNIHFASEKIRVIGSDIHVVLLPRKDTVYLNQDLRNRNKFWIHYKKYEFLKLTAPIGYIMKE